MGARKELIRFAVAGATAVGIDLVAYYLLVAWWGDAYVDAAKGISFLCGSVVAYFINKLWTFDKQGYSGSEVIRFCVVYGISFLLNILANNMMLTYLPLYMAAWVPYHKLLAFLVATGISSTSNFVGMKFWVFKNTQTQS